jgi:Family of unknown function (DUF6084)
MRHLEGSVPDLHFQVEDAVATPNAATPQLSFKVLITNSEPEPVHSIALRVQIQIEPARRRYAAREQANLKELFGEPERWSKSLHSLLWINTNVNVAGFTGSTVIEVPVPCTFDFNVAMTKYVYGLENGELPTSLLFSGTVFHAGRIGLQVAQIPWDREASYRLPVRVWKEMMDLYYPNTAWVCLRRDVFDRLCEFKAQYGIPTFEQTLERMLGLTPEVKS